MVQLVEVQVESAALVRFSVVLAVVLVRLVALASVHVFAPAPAPEPKKRLSVKQKIAEKEAMKQNNTVSSNAQVAINK